jgi:DnaK suppressor protein
MTDTAKRQAELRQVLTERRRELHSAVQTRARDGRADRSTEGRDDLERSEADSQGDIGFALAQMRTETLARIDEALGRLDSGAYGLCFECEGEIPARRLRALPFAVRCQPCEEGREQAQSHARQLAQRRSSLSLFSEMIRP